MRYSLVNKLSLVLLLLLAGEQILFRSQLGAQHSTAEQPAKALTDSLAMSLPDSLMQSWTEESTYEIMRLRLLRWLAKTKKNAGGAARENVIELLREAESFATMGDYVTAQILLETALELTSVGSMQSPIVSTAIQLEKSSQRFAPKTPWLWTRELVTGIDFWRQEFELAYGLGLAEEESLLVESSGNPFAGLRFDLSRSGSRGSDLQAHGLIKSSRDYNSGNLEFAFKQPVAPEAHVRLENRFEATSYRKTSDLRYWQNLSAVVAAVYFGRNLRLEVEDEFRVRHYPSENDFNRNYFQNEVGLGAIYTSGYATRLQARYDYGTRVHARFPYADYTEHRIEAMISQNSAQNSAVFVQNIWRKRSYPPAFSDSAASLWQSSFHDEYLNADLRIALGDRSALRVEGDLTLRQYQNAEFSPPDFLFARINPQLQLKAWQEGQASAGYIFLLQVHGTQSAANAAPSTAGYYEDYYSHGFTLGLDVFSASGFLLSVSNIYEIRTYPNNPFTGASYLDLYSDRNINSLLLFLSWNVTPRWKVGAVANLDNTKNRSVTTGDSRSSLFSLELGYSF